MGSLVQVLKDARERIAHGERVFFALSKHPEHFNDAVDLLTQALLPTAAAYQAAVLLFMRTKDDAHGRAALQLVRLPGAGLQFWDWLEYPARHQWDVLAGFDRAILRASRPTQL